MPYERGYEKTGKNQPLSFRFEMGGIDIDRLYQHVAVELQEDWCKSKPPYFEIAEAMHRKQRYKLEELMAKGVETGEITQEEYDSWRYNFPEEYIAEVEKQYISEGHVLLEDRMPPMLLQNSKYARVKQELIAAEENVV